MIYNHHGDRFIYNDKDYVVRETIISNDMSDTDVYTLQMKECSSNLDI